MARVTQTDSISIPDSDETQDEASTLDIRAIEQLKGMEAAGSFSIPGLFDVYLEHGEGYLHAIGKAIQAQEPTDLERNAHAFKGSCGYVGGTHLSKLCQQLEDMGKGGVLEGAPALYQEVQQEFHRVQIALKEYYPDETAEETRQTEDILDPAPLADLKSLEGLGDFSLQNTIDLFFEDVPKRLEAAQSAMENSDTETWSQRGISDLQVRARRLPKIRKLSRA